jgi:protein-histidine pros-kinase
MFASNEEGETQGRGMEGLFRDLLESLPDGIVLVDRAGLIVFSNPQAERLFGYPRGDLQGKPVELLLPERYRQSHA